MRRRYYDPEANRLVFLQAPATPDFWDAQWKSLSRDTLYGPVPKRSLVVVQTRRLLPRGARILEGGCGLAQNALHLHRMGYRTVALDYAPRTLVEVGRRAPEVGPVRGDVRALPLPDESLDGYWSIGVIEHWYSGYDEARDEMARVLRPGGHLFLTFPYMNPLRRVRAFLKTYPPWPGDPASRERFYQFAFDHREVLRDFETAGLALVKKVPFLGVSGLEEELPPRLSRLVQRTRGRGWFRRATRTLLAGVSRPFSSHCVLLVLTKKTRLP